VKLKDGTASGRHRSWSFPRTT